MSYLRYFFDEILSFNGFIAIIGAVLAIILMICGVNLLLFSNLARLCRANKAANKFFKTNSHINRYNRALFNRSVVKRLPYKVRKVWVESAVFYQNYCSETFATALKQTSKHGGNSTFVTYVFSYIGALILILIGLIAVGGENYYAALVASSGIFGGAVGLLVLAIELYYLDKHAERKTDSLITELKSRVTKECKNTLERNSALDRKKSKECFLESLKKVYSREYQTLALDGETDCGDKQELPIFAEKPQTSAIVYTEEPNCVENVTTVQNGVAEGVKCLECNSADDFDSLIANKGIDICKPNSPQNTIQDNSCMNVENLIEYENALSKGANPICATGVNSVSDTAMRDDGRGRSDKIAELEALINSLISDGSSEMLLTEVYDIITELTEYNFTSSLELARLKILLKRLKTAI